VTSHEFRTPITILNGYAILLRDHYHDFSEEQREECIRHITNSCQRITALLNQFITISRFQRKEATLSTEVIPVSEIFESLRAGLEPEASKRLASEIAGEDIRVASDRSYLMVLLKNIVENAIRFSPPQSPVIMRAEAEDDRVCISVRDFGTGMDASEVRNIFNPFDRLEDLDKHQTGIGLGLYIVRLIADFLNTEIEVDTRPGEGTRFSFRLPAHGGELPEPQARG
jgi:signal transduction histidine kinase